MSINYEGKLPEIVYKIQYLFRIGRFWIKMRCFLYGKGKIAGAFGDTFAVLGEQFRHHGITIID